MQYRTLGKTGFEISAISLGTWQVGGKWGDPFSHKVADRVLNAAIDQGVNFIDTADVYSAGESEKAVGRLLLNRTERIYVATKLGRKLNPHINEGYQPSALRRFVEDSLHRLGLETLDLIQLHCPPAAVYDRPEIFGLFDRLKDEGKILNLGVSVETVEEAMKAITYPNVCSVQIIFNMFRLKPAEEFFEAARIQNVGVIARVPLASGLLTGKYTSSTTFGAEDHRTFNRMGEAFDQGETFSGVPYETGLEAAEALKAIFPDAQPLSAYALKWILMHPAISCVIPGASRPEQVDQNLEALQLPDLTPAQLMGVREVYDHFIRPFVHHRW